MLDVDLQLLQAFQLPSGGIPYGLAAVGGGQVLVLVGEWRTMTLQLLDLTTGRWQTLLGEERLRQAISLVYNQARKQLCVGGWGDYDVKVYALSE